MRGLYVITDASITDPELLHQQVGEAVAGGTCLVQFRHKSIDSGLYLALAEAVLEACRPNFTPCLINDQVAVAKFLAADGAHLGQGDGSLLDARQALGPNALIGRTCHRSKELMKQAVAEGASYCAFGRLFESDTKPVASGLRLDQLKDLISESPIPTVAIGGITLDNGQQILETGVAMLAVSGAVFRAKDIGEAARRLSELF